MITILQVGKLSLIKSLITCPNHSYVISDRAEIENLWLPEPIFIKAMERYPALFGF